jgi:hypothetical protein
MRRGLDIGGDIQISLSRGREGWLFIVNDSHLLVNGDLLALDLLNSQTEFSLHIADVAVSFHTVKTLRSHCLDQMLLFVLFLSIVQ